MTNVNANMMRKRLSLKEEIMLKRQKDAIVKRVTFGLNANRESVRLEWVDGKIRVMNGKEEIKPVELLNFKKYDLYPYLGEKSCLWQRLGDKVKVEFVKVVTEINEIAESVIRTEVYEPVEEKLTRLEDASYFKIWNMIDPDDQIEWCEEYEDGKCLYPDDVIAEVKAQAQALLRQHEII